MQNIPHRIINSLQLLVSKFATFSSPVSVCEVYPNHVDVVHVTADSSMKYWNAISLCQPRILPAPVTHVANVSTNTNKCHVDCHVLFHLMCPTLQIQTHIRNNISFSNFEGKCISIYFFFIYGFCF